MKVKGQAFSGDRNCWVYILGDTEAKFSNAAAMHPPLSADEVNRLKALKKWWTDGGQADNSTTTVVTRSLTTAPRASIGNGDGKMRFLGDIGYDQFSDIIFKVSHRSSVMILSC